VELVLGQLELDHQVYQFAKHVTREIFKAQLVVYNVQVIHILAHQGSQPVRNAQLGHMLGTQVQHLLLNVPV
jgi:hypothetical protein